MMKLDTKIAKYLQFIILNLLYYDLKPKISLYLYSNNGYFNKFVQYGLKVFKSNYTLYNNQKN